MAILWRNHLPAVPISSISSDRFAAIQIPLTEDQSLSIIGVYLPSTDHPVSEYVEYLTELESTISASGPVMIVGDFNAHLGPLGCQRNDDAPNPTGRLLFDVICRCDLFAVSQSALANGARYTFANSIHQTTVDYCLLDCTYAHLVKSCYTLFPGSLNLSDHLPLVMQLDVQPSICVPPRTTPGLNWQKGLSDGHMDRYIDQVSSLISPLLCSPPPLDSKDLQNEISYVCHQLSNIANNIIPSKKKEKKKSKAFLRT